MIAVDSNILVYAHRRDSPWHGNARAALRQLAEGGARWAIPWPCVHEFYAVVTHPRIYTPPSTRHQALVEIEGWLASPDLVLLTESEAYWPELRRLLDRGKVAGPAVHDARIVALCATNGVKELWSADRDFSRFPSVRVRNPAL